MNYNF